jgi:hypothetical protein
MKEFRFGAAKKILAAWWEENSKSAGLISALCADCYPCAAFFCMGMTTRQIFKDGAVAAGIVISFLAFLILTFRLLCVIGREHAINALREAAKEHVADLLAAYLENHKLRTVAVQAALVRERLEKGYRADIMPLSQALDEILIVVDHSINTNGATMGVKPFIVN